jgi:regulator of cell morphogenesis and NO signaling
MITTKTSIRELVEINPANAHLFWRFGIFTPQDFGIDVAASRGMVDAHFLVDVLNYYNEFEELDPVKLKSYPLPVLVDYLEKSHQYYINKKLPEIEQTLTYFVSSSHEKPGLWGLVELFYLDYKKSLTDHFDLEEKQLFPYGIALDDFKKGKINFEELVAIKKSFSTDEFMRQHMHGDHELELLRNTIRTFTVKKEMKSSYSILFNQIASLEQDLNIHSQVEDEVLIPKIKEWETKLFI